MKLRLLDLIALIILIVGGINWGLIGLSQLDSGAWVLNLISNIETMIYVLVGLSALYIIVRVLKRK